MRQGAVLLLTTALVAMVMAVGTVGRPAYASSFTVNSTGDVVDANTGDGVCETATPEECTLRAAIQQANANNNDATVVDVIHFNISGTGPHTISLLTTALPDITEPVIIDGYSQPGAKANTLAVGDDAVLKIELRGAGQASGNGLKISADNSMVKGLVISNWDNGIFLGPDVTGSKVQGNFIGTGLKNNIGVALTNATSSTIGGTTASARNIISGNDAWGIHISDAESTFNKVQGNYIGVKANGTEALGNGFNGVSIQTGAANNTIGGTTASAGNIISNNGSSGSATSDLKSGVEIQYDNNDGLKVAAGNRILSNSIYDNAELGIDLYYTNNPPGVTDNDYASKDSPPDSDTGPNHLQNYPDLESAKTRRGVTTIKGTLSSNANSKFTIQFFSNGLEADASGHGEGQKFKGQKSVTDTNGDGIMPFTFKTKKKVPKGQFVTATATVTDPAGNPADQSKGDTSEFSTALSVS